MAAEQVIPAVPQSIEEILERALDRSQIFSRQANDQIDLGEDPVPLQEVKSFLELQPYGDDADL